MVYLCRDNKYLNYQIVVKHWLEHYFENLLTICRIVELFESKKYAKLSIF